jgi:hypothetical protein
MIRALDVSGCRARLFRLIPRAIILKLRGKAREYLLHRCRELTLLILGEHREDRSGVLLAVLGDLAGALVAGLGEVDVDDTFVIRAVLTFDELGLLELVKGFGKRLWSDSQQIGKVLLAYAVTHRKDGEDAVLSVTTRPAMTLVVTVAMHGIWIVEGDDAMATVMPPVSVAATAFLRTIGFDDLVLDVGTPAATHENARTVKLLHEFFVVYCHDIFLVFFLARYA